MNLAGNAEERRGCWRDGVLKASCQPASAPCNLASAPLRLGHGLSPYKKAKKQIFLRERAPDEICFYLFCMACSFREKKCLHYGKRYGRLIFAVT